MAGVYRQTGTSWMDGSIPMYLTHQKGPFSKPDRNFERRILAPISPRGPQTASILGHFVPFPNWHECTR